MRTHLLALALLVVLLAACSGDDKPSVTVGGDAAMQDGSSLSDAQAVDGAPSGWMLPTPANPLLSQGVPAFASSGTPSLANDGNPASSWFASAPAWIAYDLSSAAPEQRHQVLVGWDAIHAPCYIDTATSPTGSHPIDYSFEVNNAPGGGTPPSAGWTTALTVTASRYCARQYVFDMGGANWLRMTITTATSDGIAIDLEVHGAINGASDSWLFMGDSITYMSTTYAFSDLPKLTNAQSPKHWPAVIDAALGGTNTNTAQAVINDTMKDFPGRFVVLAYGTNDGNGFNMEPLVKAVIAAGKTPVVPHMPWSSGSTNGVAINALIDALYAKYPAIVHGPDLWAVFEGHTEWIPMGDVHPNAAGQEQLRMAWAKAMAATY